MTLRGDCVLFVSNAAYGNYNDQVSGAVPSVQGNGKRWTIADLDAGVSQALGSYDESYGVIWDATADTYQIGTTKNGTFTAQAIPSFPIQAGMKRCVLSDAGVVQYYLLSTDSTKKADGTAANIDGTDGQVMVEIPKFHYIQTHYLTKRYMFVSRYPFTLTLPDASTVTSTIHPFFYKGGSATASDYRYIGAYEGAMWDTSKSAYSAGADVVGNIYAAGDKMASVSGQYPKTGETIVENRAMAVARGTGWHQYDHPANHALSMLYITEFGSLNSQLKIGNGRTGLSGGGWTAGSYIAACGLSNGIGNATGNVSAGGAGGIATDYMSYRGIENWFGHVWKFLDGVNVHNSSANRSRLYLHNNYSQYASDTATNYTLAGLLAETDGYATDIVAGTFCPSAVGGGSGTYLCDYYYTYFNDNPDSGWKIALVGGNAIYGVLAGAFFLNSLNGATGAAVHFGGRLCF
jgi:hypothetical protein